MSISLKNWIEKSNGDDAFVIDVLSQNRIHDDILDKDDLAIRYGSTATEAMWTDIEDALSDYDQAAYEQAFIKLDLKSREVLSNKFMSGFATLESRLKKFGITSSNVQIPQRLNSDGEDKNEAKRQAAASELAPVLSQVYQDEFGCKLPPETAFMVMNDALDSATRREPISAQTMIDYALKVYGDRLSEDVSGQGDYFQSQIYAPSQINEYRQSARLAKLEEKFQMDIRTTGAPLNDDEIGMIEDVLTKISERRPGDLSLLKTLRLTRQENRLGGYTDTTSSSINLSGPFAPPDSKSRLPEHYAATSQLSSQTAPTRSYLYNLLTHELGHLVAHRDGKKNSGFDVPANYEALLPNNAHEWFSEDYSTFLTSNGERVADVNIAGVMSPNYEERLAYFKANYTLNGIDATTIPNN